MSIEEKKRFVRLVKQSESARRSHFVEVLTALFTFLFLFVFCSSVQGQDRSSVLTNITYASNIMTNKAWVKHILTEKGGNPHTLRDSTGLFASAADIAALHEVTESITEIEEAWSNGFARGYAELYSVLTNVPKHGITLGLRFPLNPDGRQSFDIYVASNYYNSANNTDHLFVFFSKELALRPNIFIPYVWNGGYTTNRVKGTWKDWGREIGKHTIVKGDFTYSNCVELVVNRPTELQGMLADLNPHGTFGSPEEGMNWGSLILTINGQLTLSGDVTNSLITADHPQTTLISCYNGAILNPGFNKPYSYPNLSTDTNMFLCGIAGDYAMLSNFGTVPANLPTYYRDSNTNEWTASSTSPAPSGQKNNMTLFVIPNFYQHPFWHLGSSPVQ